MSIARLSSARRIVLALGLLSSFTLVGCDSGGGGVTEADLNSVTDGAKGKAQAEARQKAYGATGNAVTTKAGVAPPKPAPEKAP